MQQIKRLLRPQRTLRTTARRYATRDLFYQAGLPVHPSWKRQAPSPYDESLSIVSAGWLRELPKEVAPRTLASKLPRIVNRLSHFWDSPRMIEAYFQELLVDRRGRRKGFPRRIMDELYALAQYYRSLHPARLEGGRG